MKVDQNFEIDEIQGPSYDGGAMRQAQSFHNLSMSPGSVPLAEGGGRGFTSLGDLTIGGLDQNHVQQTSSYVETKQFQSYGYQC